jgi:transposase
MREVVAYPLQDALMSSADLFPSDSGLAVTDTTITNALIAVAVISTDPTAVCPACGQPSGRIHSRYRRTLADLPSNGRRFILRLTARRFFCASPGCNRAVFCERLPGLAAARARSTSRLADLHRAIGFAVGGEPGSRLAEHLAAPISGDTILRRVTAASDEPAPAYRYVGIDDFAFRKGHSYGTILVDLERGRVIDIFDGRDGSAVETWLKAHPGVEVITRDRWAGYANAATAGAPQATQVADRWHLLRNLLEALIGAVDRHHADVRAAAQQVRTDEGKADREVPAPIPAGAPGEHYPSIVSAGRPLSDQAQARRARRLNGYEQVRALHRQGLSGRQIAARLGIDRGTVKRFIERDSFPERAERRYRRTTDAFAEYLAQRVGEGCRNAARLFEDLKARGYCGSYYAVRRQVARWRRPAGPAQARDVTQQVRSALTDRPSPRRVSWLLLKAEPDLEQAERTFRDRLVQRSPQLGAAAELGRDFRRMIRDRRPDDWNDWMARATAPTAAKELRTFAEGLKKDEKAVRAALQCAWSNGPVEGQVHRLKLVKRSGYGRAGFRLLRARVRHKT